MPLKSKSKLVGIPTADGKFRCIWCPKTYCKSKHARRHMLLHTGERPYDCPHCTMNFTRADIRKRHVIKCAQKQEDSSKADEIAKTDLSVEPLVEPVAEPVVEPVVEEHQHQHQHQQPQTVEYTPQPEFFDEPQFPYYFFEQQDHQHIPQQQLQQEQHLQQDQQQHQHQHQHQLQHEQQQQEMPMDSPLTPLMEPIQNNMPLMEMMPAMSEHVESAPSKFPLLQQHPTLYAHDDHVNLSNLIDSLSQSALPLHYQLLHSDSDSLESISETSASDEGEFFEPLNWSLEGLM